jgi:2'-5' RNA ligase
MRDQLPGSGQWRLFLGIELPSQVLQPLAQTILRARRGGLAHARWVDPEKLHLTLAFLGNRDPADVGLLRHELTPLLERFAPIELRLKGLGAFPSLKRPKILWLGVEPSSKRDEESLFGLEAELRQYLHNRLQIEPERRPVRPHITLARGRRPFPVRQVARLSRDFEPLTGMGWQAGSTTQLGGEPNDTTPLATLWRSHLSNAGSRYEVLARFH